MNSQRVHGRATSVLELRHLHSRRPCKSPGSSFDTAALLAAYSGRWSGPSSRVARSAYQRTTEVFVHNLVAVKILPSPRQHSFLDNSSKQQIDEIITAILI